MKKYTITFKLDIKAKNKEEAEEKFSDILELTKIDEIDDYCEGSCLKEANLTEIKLCPEPKNKTKCPKCNDTGVIETGNNDLPCSCPKGDTAIFNTCEYGQVTGKYIKQKERKKE